MIEICPIINAFKMIMDYGNQFELSITAFINFCFLLIRGTIRYTTAYNTDYKIVFFPPKSNKLTSNSLKPKTGSRP